MGNISIQELFLLLFDGQWLPSRHLFGPFIQKKRTNLQSSIYFTISPNVTRNLSYPLWQKILQKIYKVNKNKNLELICLLMKPAINDVTHDVTHNDDDVTQKMITHKQEW